MENELLLGFIDGLVMAGQPFRVFGAVSAGDKIVMHFYLTPVRQRIAGADEQRHFYSEPDFDAFNRIQNQKTKLLVEHIQIDHRRAVGIVFEFVQKGWRPGRSWERDFAHRVPVAA